jgi:fatty-acyl-CoA synthase
MNASFIGVTGGDAGRAPAKLFPSPAKAWLRALELTTPIANNPRRILPVVIEEVAKKVGDAPALLSDDECFTYRALVERSNGYARWALDFGISQGDTVCLMMPNRPEYLAIWLGITQVGGVVALLNTNLRGSSLAHCVSIASPKHIIVGAELLDQCCGAMRREKIWVHGGNRRGFPRVDCLLQRYTGDELRAGERRPVTIHDRALYIYTSGTTGVPKAANVSHARLMQWSHWFAGMMEMRSSDRLYNCLPMYHSAAGVLAAGAVLSAGGSLVIRRGFSARQFWDDVVRWDCTLFQYIGELCRYLLNTESHLGEVRHRIRMCCGNGLRPEIWNDFKNRFRIPQILEFYASTEGNLSLFNVEGRPGAVGRIPPYLASRFPVALVQFDRETNEPIRNGHGFCVPCVPGEVGEAIGKILKNSSNIGSRFEGYTSEEASEKKILRDVFEPGDAWYRSGDLLRKDERGYFFFVDRIGDTFRWKGENVATSEVAEAICGFRDIRHAVVYGVAVPGVDGRAGMATLVADDKLDLPAFRAHLIDRLPAYAVPVFLRCRQAIEMTETFKPKKHVLQSQGYDPAATGDAIYFHDRESQAFVPLDQALYDRIQGGHVRL